jgi:hypothetical protein
MELRNSKGYQGQMLEIDGIKKFKRLSRTNVGNR